MPWLFAMTCTAVIVGSVAATFLVRWHDRREEEALMLPEQITLQWISAACELEDFQYRFWASRNVRSGGIIPIQSRNAAFDAHLKKMEGRFGSRLKPLRELDPATSAAFKKLTAAIPSVLSPVCEKHAASMAEELKSKSPFNRILPSVASFEEETIQRGWIDKCRDACRLEFDRGAKRVLTPEAFK